MPSGKCGSGAIRAGEGLLGIHRELCKGVDHPTPFPGHVCIMGPTKEAGGLKGGSRVRPKLGMASEKHGDSMDEWKYFLEYTGKIYSP